MAAYVADAYNAALPLAADIAGHADKEIRAIKERLNAQIGASTVLNLGTRLTAAEGSITTQGTSIASLGTRLATAEGTLITQGQSISSQGSAISSNTQAINSANSTITSQGQAITNQGTRLTTAESSIASHTSSINSLTSRMTATEGQANSAVSWINTAGAPAITALQQRGQVVGITSAPSNSWGNEGDLLVWYV